MSFSKSYLQQNVNTRANLYADVQVSKINIKRFSDKHVRLQLRKKHVAIYPKRLVSKKRKTILSGDSSRSCSSTMTPYTCTMVCSQRYSYVMFQTFLVEGWLENYIPSAMPYGEKIMVHIYSNNFVMTACPCSSKID